MKGLNMTQQYQLPDGTPCDQYGNPLAPQGQLVQHQAQPSVASPTPGTGITGNNPPALPAHLTGAFKKNFESMLDDYGQAFKRISLKGRVFTLNDGSSKQTLMVMTTEGQMVPAASMDVCILGANPGGDFCTYYENEYVDGDAVQPDYLWFKGSGFPPPIKDICEQERPDGRKNYNTRRRLVVVQLKKTPDGTANYLDTNNLYVLDIGGSSIYGKDSQNPQAFSLASLSRFCTSMNLDGPGYFACRMIFTQESVPSVRFIPASSNGQLVFWDPVTLEKVAALAASNEVQKLLEVKVINGPKKELPQETAPVQAPAAAPVQQVVQPDPQPAPAVQPQTVVAAPATVVSTPAQQPVTTVAATPAVAPTAQVVEAQPVGTPAASVVQQAVPAAGVLDPALAAQIQTATTAAAQVIQPAAAPDDLDAELDALIG